VPSLAAQIALKTGLCLDEPPHQHTHLGCAAPLFSLKIATDYCRRRDRAAIVFCFDQNTWHVITHFHPDDPNLKQKMRANLLFSDGAVGLLLIPESMRENYAKPLPRILDVVTSFHAGDLMRMHNGDFLVERDVPRVMPPLVMDKLVRPAMARLGIAAEEVTEWSIHQGGPAILDELCKEAHLGLTGEQAIRSRDLFHRYGNLSGPSCLFLLDDYFHGSALPEKAPALGLVVGFGAGYYFGLTAYQWQA
jgi:predicted naringenin-chalcone synthase